MNLPDNPFSKMQRAFYTKEAEKWSPDNRDPVVGSFDAHNQWADYELLFAGMDTAGKVALDFGCGPGRGIVRFAPRFARIDGADISVRNLMNALKWALRAPYRVEKPILYPTNGTDLRGIEDAQYDVVMSTICFQHIPVHDIRFNLMKEFHRVLKPGGWFTAQMGYGDTGYGLDAEYHENKYDAPSTNGGCDVKVTSVLDLIHDTEAIGFENFSSDVRPIGPFDRHPNWIFFRCQKPL